jgi:adenylate kinase family enzyme
MKRIVLIGTSCSGKSHLGKILARKYQVPHIELDDLYWLPDWRERPDKEFISLVKDRVAQNEWVIDGNYSVVRDLVWPKATTIIWLNYSLHLVLIRAIKRSFLRAAKKERLFADNVETFKQSFFSRDSIILWALKTHRSNKEQYSVLLKSEWARNAEVKVFTKPSQVSKYVGSDVLD